MQSRAKSAPIVSTSSSICAAISWIIDWLYSRKKPAPIQISWLGYPNTTGMQSVDYRLTDALADPPASADALYSEKLVRLPHAFFVYEPPVDAPPVQALPMLSNGYVTFGSFNNLTKNHAGGGRPMGPAFAIHTGCPPSDGRTRRRPCPAGQNHV